MTTSRVQESARTGFSEEIVFAGDGVRLAGQIDYPHIPTRHHALPLIFVLHHAGPDAREGYGHFARTGLRAGFAVFRWDKRGTGRSGASGKGSTIQDAVNAYEVALEQPYVDRRRAVIVAQDAGAGMLGDAFGLFARVQLPVGVALVTNTLDPEAILAIETQLLIMVGQNDWNPWQQYGKSACDAHNAAYRHGSTYYVAPNADRMLYDPRTGRFHFGAESALHDWLKSL